MKRSFAQVAVEPEIGSSEHPPACTPRAPGGLIPSGGAILTIAPSPPPFAPGARRRVLPQCRPDARPRPWSYGHMGKHTHLDSGSHVAVFHRHQAIFNHPTRGHPAGAVVASAAAPRLLITI